jgi:tetratricopeptide (TPR) repeat protein
MIRGLRALAIPLLLAACSTARPAPWAAAPAPPADLHAAARLLAHADDLAEHGQAQEAYRMYERVLREYPADPAGASALYGLGRLQTAPAGPLRNYRAAQATFSRLLSEYPHSRWEREARAWRAVLGDLQAREEESARLRSQIEQLRRTDLELERRH